MHESSLSILDCVDESVLCMQLQLLQLYQMVNYQTKKIYKGYERHIVHYQHIKISKRAICRVQQNQNFFLVIFEKTNGSIFQYTTLFFEMLARNKTIMCRFLFRFYCQFNCIEITFCRLILQFGFPFDCNSRWKISSFLIVVGIETFY